jgi:hypothetical protein
MPPKPGRNLPDDGGCGFGHDPKLPVEPNSARWLPEVSPGTLILEEAPSGFATVIALDATPIGSVVTDIEDADGHELVLVDGTEALHVRLGNNRSSKRPALLVPLDITSLELRLDVALRFARRLRGQPGKLLPAALRLTTQQKRRFVQLLHAFDIHALGGGPRDVAELVLRSEHARFPSVEWKDSHARRAANRLIHDSNALVQGDYLKLLRGG